MKSVVVALEALEVLGVPEVPEVPEALSKSHYRDMIITARQVSMNMKNALAALSSNPYNVETTRQARTNTKNAPAALSNSIILETVQLVRVNTTILVVHTSLNSHQKSDMTNTTQQVRTSMKNALAAQSSNPYSVKTSQQVRMNTKNAPAALSSNININSVKTSQQVRTSMKNAPIVLHSRSSNMNSNMSSSINMALWVKRNSRKALVVLTNRNSSRNPTDTALQVKMNTRNAAVAPSSSIDRALQMKLSPRRVLPAFTNRNSNRNRVDRTLQVKMNTKNAVEALASDQRRHTATVLTATTLRNVLAALVSSQQRRHIATVPTAITLRNVLVAIDYQTANVDIVLRMIAEIKSTNRRM
jgi:hypothetical protein